MTGKLSKTKGFWERGIKEKILLCTAAFFILLSAAVIIMMSSYGIVTGVAQSKHKILPISEMPIDGSDKLHFLSTQIGDCILIESQGRFALVDAAEDTKYPPEKPNINLTGFEQKVIDYLTKVCGDEQGNIKLDFVVGTHAHSDHIGGFDELILNEKVMVERAYLKRYDEKYIKQMEIDEWDNKIVYDDMIEACRVRGVELVQDLSDEPFSFGSYTVKLMNTELPTETNLGENENSLAVYLERGDKKILLMGDVNYHDGDEQRIAKEVGKIDLLKVGHHGFGFSTGTVFLSHTKPDIAVITNALKNVTPTVRLRLALTSRSAVFGTVDRGGIIAVIGDDIKLYSGIH